MKNELNYNELILKELNKISRILIELIIEGKNQGKQIETLNKIGLQPKNIAQILNTTPNNVRVSINRLKKGKK